MCKIVIMKERVDKIKMTNIYLYKIKKDHLRENLVKYTRKAFELLPKYDNPQILDVGCGAGIPTIELAKLSGGHITGIDIDRSSLERFRKKLRETELVDKIEIIEKSLFALDFPDESFDIIWAEGSISAIGFEEGLKQLRRFLKLNGFLVIHDDISDTKKKLKLISNYNYILISRFKISHKEWWLKYYAPLEKLIKEFHNNFLNDYKLINVLNKDQGEIDRLKSNPTLFGSMFYTIRKEGSKQ
ncbi:MAG: methyltransferase domain-containing protein [Bacteroidetes bacterium]|nr:methyltransferase domain-containing protein [Bacteroidota bacterium]